MDRKNLAMFLVGGLIVALGLAFFLSPLASSSPDGLEKVSVDEGFDSTAKDHDLADSPLADYGVRGVEDEGLSTCLAGIIGVVVTFGLGLLLFAAIRSVRARGETAPPSPA